MDNIFPLPPRTLTSLRKYEGNIEVYYQLLEQGVPGEPFTVQFVPLDEDHSAIKGSYPHSSDYEMGIQQVSEDELLIGPYNISLFVFTYFAHHRRTDKRGKFVKQAVGKVLRKRRKELDLTQKALSKKISTDHDSDAVSQRTISRIENGRVLPLKETLKALCQSLDMSFFFCLQRTSRLYWEMTEGESFPSLKEEYDLEE